MTAHRYWRVKLLRARGGGGQVELSELWLLKGGSRVDGPASLSSSVAPIAGDLAALRDDSLATSALLPVGAVLTFDFGGSPTSVDDLRLGSADTESLFPAFMSLEASQDGLEWAPFNLTVAWGGIRIRWPGARTQTANLRRTGWDRAASSGAVLSGEPPTLASVGTSTATATSRTPKSAGCLQFEVVTSGVSNGFFVGVRTPGTSGLTGVRGYLGNTGQKFSGSLSAYGASFDIGDVVGCVVDFGAGTVRFYKNGVDQGIAFSDVAGLTLRPTVTDNVNNNRVYTLREYGFSFPVVGADPWEDGTYLPTEFPAELPPLFVVETQGFDYPFNQSATPVEVQRARPDFNFNPTARGRIAATVKRKDTPTNVPLSRRVRLYRDRDGMFIRETWSDAQGNYHFDYIEEWEAYTVISFDHTRNHRAVAADNLTLANGGITLLP